MMSLFLRKSTPPTIDKHTSQTGSSGVLFVNSVLPKHCLVLDSDPRHRNSTTCTQVRIWQASAKPPGRKPRGYWSDLENIRKELFEFLQTCNDAKEGVLPTSKQLRAAGRRDLDNAISKMGGYTKMAKMLGFASTSERRVSGYWNSFDNLRSELLDFLDDNESTIPKGRMPTQQQLREMKRSDIVEGIRKHGGSAEVANKLGLLQRQAKKPKHYWKDWAAVEAEIREFVEQRDRNDRDRFFRRSAQRMPSQKELRLAGRADLAEAISDFHGGFRDAAKRLGFVSNKKDDFFYDNFYNVAQELYALVDEIGASGVMPSTAALKERSRTDLAAAIVRYGGMSEVSQRLGLQYQIRTREAFKDWNIFRKSLLSFMEKHDKRGEIPSSRTLSNFGRTDLYQGILHHGGSKEVADRMGLKRNYWQDFHHVGKEVLEFVNTHGTEAVMPTEREFLEVGRSALNVAVSKFGHSQVAKRLGLTEPPQSTRVAFEALLSQSVFPTECCDECRKEECEAGDVTLGDL